ncbi:hypothetical protein MUY27_18220 [Mucilaginibacter sp. RS28]|uniref:Uncharacterized protein n=1 Tax=Mucilaginibacter straminoryzae TaxID=2932774 RepID=A0A9X1X7N0_9SPHI|nr:hypothetical protein [Mucilaginibacter straminoryzae]MCJ8211660.1 hypothetical protein [Mucilaginibacter straminoryzae]
MSLISKITNLSSTELSIISIIISSLSLICSLYYNRIFSKTYRLSKKEHLSKLSNFTLYLINSFSRDEKKSGRRFLLFNVTISNKATLKNSFLAYLEIQYVGNENEVKHIVIDYSPADLKLDLTKSLTLFSSNITLEEKTSESKWFVFQYPSDILMNNRILKYVLRLSDVDNHTDTLEVFLIKDLGDEN